MLPVTGKAQPFTSGQMPPTIRKGPVEGIVIVNGRPQTERVDMPTISFESIQALMEFNERRQKEKSYHSAKKRGLTQVLDEAPLCV